MKTLIFETKVNALTQISHNGGEINGNVSAFRRMKVVQPNGKYIDIPHVSGNAVRGKLRDLCAKITLDALGEGNDPMKASPELFQLLFSGGTLTSGNTQGDIDKHREMREKIPMISLFGGAWGNAILQGKMKINPFIPIAQETNHILPPAFRDSAAPSVFTYLQLQMFTRRENTNDMEFQPYLERQPDQRIETSQMIYYTETMAAGTPFYWRVVLEDVTDEEFDLFLTVMSRFERVPVTGGKGSVGFGQIQIEQAEWKEMIKQDNSLSIVNETTESLYMRYISDKKDSISAFMKKI